MQRLSSEPRKSRNTSAVEDEEDRTQNRLENFSSSLQELLSTFNAEVETSKFSVQKVAEGTMIDFSFRAIIKSRRKNKA
jgi:uncharacterized FlaG/YvyC family protein